MIRVLFLLFSAMFIAGCATNGFVSSKDTVETISSADLNENTGIVFGSFTRNTQHKGIIEAVDYDKRSLRFRNVETGALYSIDKVDHKSLIWGGVKPHFEEEVLEGAVFAFVLPAGKYIIYDFYIEKYQHGSWTSKKVFSIPFEVAADKVSYLGRYNFNATFGRNLLGFKVHDAGFWVLGDELEKDKGYANNIFPGIPLDNVLSVIPNEKEVQTPFVLFETELEKE